MGTSISYLHANDLIATRLALDSESEKVVQAALDVAANGCTTIAVAHRLRTVQNADMIDVLDGGRVVESRRHSDLLARQARYLRVGSTAKSTYIR